MNDDELIQYIGKKFKHCKNKINSVKEVFPKEAKEGNRFDEIFYKVMEDYVIEKIKKN